MAEKCNNKNCDRVFRVKGGYCQPCTDIHDEYKDHISADDLKAMLKLTVMNPERVEQLKTTFEAEEKMNELASGVLAKTKEINEKLKNQTDDIVNPYKTVSGNFALIMEAQKEMVAMVTKMAHPTEEEKDNEGNE
jgi:hypothetical protein